MPRGDSFKRYWQDYREGKITLAENHGVRGKDKPGTIRKITSTDKTMATRYYERTGRRLDMEMADERALIEIMLQGAMGEEDPDVQFDKVDKARKALSDFNTRWAPYLEQKLDTLKSDQKLEDKISLEDALNGTIEIEDKTDEDPGS